jgi:hypothetical protein
LVPALAIYFDLPGLPFYVGSYTIHPDQKHLFMVADLLRWWAFVSYPLGVLMILGAVSLRQLQSRWLALTGAVVAVLPWSPAWLLGLPMGIWALVVQNRREVENAFGAQTTDSESVRQRIRHSGAAFFVVGLIGVPASLVLAPVALTSVILAVAGWKMMSRPSYGWAIAGCMVAVLPLTVAWPVSFPIGLWALATLTRPDAKAAFAAAEAGWSRRSGGTGVSPKLPDALQRMEERHDAGPPSSAPPAALLVDRPPSRRSLWRRARLLATLTLWTAVLVGALGYLMPLVWNDWWPWAFKERWFTALEPQSRAYTVRLGLERGLYHWGQHHDRPIIKRPWIGTALIDLPSQQAAVTLEFDSFLDQWRWTPPVNETTRSQSEPRPEFVVQLLKAGGIDISKPGVQEEAAALVGFVKDAANGLLPGGRHPRDYAAGYGTKFGPFISGGAGGGGTVLGEGAVGPVPTHLVGATLLAVTWLPGLVIIVRRHRRRLAAAGETEQRYRLGTIGFWGALFCLFGAVATLVLPWVLLSSSSGPSLPGSTESSMCAFGALSNWYGTVAILAFLTVLVLCFLTDFFSVRRSWQPPAMIAAGTIVVVVTGILFWRLTGPPATVRVAEIQRHDSPEMVALVTTVGCWQEYGLMWGTSIPEDMFPKTLQQRSGPGLQLALALGLGLLMMGCIAMRRARGRGTGA